MKILFIHNRYQHEGGEDVAFELEVNLFRQNHEIEVLMFNNDHILTLADKVQAAIRSIYNFASARKVRHAIQTFRPDIIHVHNLFFAASPSVLVVAHKANIPVIVTLHNYRMICCNALLLRDNKICELCINKKLPIAGIKYKCYHNSAVHSALVIGITGIHKIFRTWNKYVSTYISLTQFSRQKLFNSSLQLSDNRLLAIPNFVPDIKYNVLERENYFLYVGRLSEEKGVPVLLKAFEQIQSENLLIVGDGPQRPLLEKQYQSIPNIRFAGKKEGAEVLQLMSKCKALLFPSLCYENLPFTIIEAYSTATPVIASGIGAMLEMIKDSINGFHFNPGDAEDLKKVILMFIQLGEEEQKKLSFQARLSYEENFHPHAHYKALMSVYEKAIEGKGK